MPEKKTDILNEVRQNRIILLISVVCGILGAVLIYIYLSDKDKQYRQFVAVTTLDRELSKGTILQKNFFKKKNIPMQFTIPRAVTWDEKEALVGTRIIINAPEGQIVTWDHVEVTMLKKTFSDKLDSTQRAITLSVDEYSAVAGHIAAGDRVDVMGLFTLPNPGKRATTITKTILQYVPVLAVGHSGNVSSNYSSITLQVTPLEAELLFFAESHGSLKFTLRNRENLTIEEIDVVDFSNLHEVGGKVNKKKRLRVRYGNKRK